MEELPLSELRKGKNDVTRGGEKKERIAILINTRGVRNHACDSREGGGRRRCITRDFYLDSRFVRANRLRESPASANWRGPCN